MLGAKGCSFPANNSTDKNLQQSYNRQLQISDRKKDYTGTVELVA